MARMNRPHATGKAMNDESAVFDVRQTAEYLQLNEYTVRRLARGGKIPAFKVGGVWRFKKASIERWTDSQEIPLMRGTVVVIDDEATVLQLVQRILSPEGFIVRTAASGPEGLALIEQERPDVVLLDLMLPEMDGAEILGALRDTFGMELPVVILTAFPDSALMTQAMIHSPLMLLCKPFRPEQLIQTVNTIVLPVRS